jgi:SAM-dependent methyltransferase
MSELELLRLTDLPTYQNKMFNTAAEALNCPRGDVILSQNNWSGLIRNIAFDSTQLNYDESYQNEQAHSAIFQRHLSDVLQIIQRQFLSSSILEVGCGKGAFLDQLRGAGHDAWGIDPAYEGDAAYITRAAFSPELDLRRDAIIMRHVLEHIPQPYDFLNEVRRANGGAGIIYIEVPCLEWILQNSAWFDIFYEHVNYFRLVDFTRLFGKVLESGHLFGGQYIYVVADLASLRDPGPCPPGDYVCFPPGFLDNIQRAAEATTEARARVIWGCGAKGVMFAHHLSQRGLNLDFAIDINPAKHGKFLASSGIPVLSPERGLARAQAGTDIYVMNSNYLSEIQSLGGRAFNYIPLDIQ